MRRNPLKEIRVRYGFTQEQLATKLGMTRQIVMDAEQGMFSQPPPSIVAYLAQYNAEAIAELRSDYALWVAEKRRDGTAVAAFSRLVETPYSFQDLCGQVGGSVRGFCRAITLQRSIADNYIKNGHRWDMIADALDECGIPDKVIELISRLPRS